MEKTYNFLTNEQEIRQLWEGEKVFTFNPSDPKKIFSIDTPPPTVSGVLHIGSIFSYTQADIIARFKRLQGFEIFYPFGFDDNGLATERFVEKKRDVSPYSLGRSAFINVCLEETAIAQQEFKEVWQTVGLSVDWNLWYSTISKPVRKISQQSFIELYQKDFIYRKNEPALYCTKCGTSVAQAELDDKEVQSNFYDLAFLDNKGQRLTISTTRPELLASCVALLYHPQDKRYKALKNGKAIVPIYNYEVPIIADEAVIPDKGTGLVMCCTFGDKQDIAWYLKHKLPYRQSIGRNGKWTSLAGSLEGLKVADARKKIIEELTAAGFISNQRQITHSVNVHERCKHEIEYLIIQQWFLKILEHKKEFLALGNQVNWHPTHMKARYTNWVENLGWDWCLSRQRFFGIPFPAWHCQTCNAVLLATPDQLPVDPQETPYGKPCPKCGKEDITPDTDVMDTWNTSSLTPYICYHLLQPEAYPFDKQVTQWFLPMSMRPQGHDIIRTWAFYTLVKTWMHNKTLAWKSLVISGHALSAQAEKISKSRGNAPKDPRPLMEQWSADAIRYWTASAALGADVPFAENQLKIAQKLVTKLWNACSFIEQHTKTIDPTKTPTSFGIVNEWILDAASKTFAAYEKELNNNEFHAALSHAETFFWSQFCDNYLELIKHQLFNPENADQEQLNATRWTLYWVGLRILQWYAPYLPYVTEKLYQEMYRTHLGIPSLHRTTYQAAQKPYTFPASARDMDELLRVIGQVRKTKTLNQLSLKAEIAQLVVHTKNTNTRDAINKHVSIVRGVTHAVAIVVNDQPQKDLIIKQDDQLIMHIALEEPQHHDHN